MDTNIKREYRVTSRLEWFDSPPMPLNKNPKKTTGKWASVANRMRRIHKKNHGKWAKVATDVHFTTGSKLKKQFPDIAWTVRKNTSGKYELWASYPAPVDSASEND
jgi:hypothetical protein